MLLYINVSSGLYPVTVDMIRMEWNGLFGEEPTPEILDDLGLAPVEEVPRPDYDPATQICVEGDPVRDGDRWVQSWVVSDRPVAPVDPRANFIPTYLFRQRAEAIGVWEDLATFLMQSPPMLLKVLTLEEGIDPSDKDLNAGFDTLQIPTLVRGFLLAPPSVGIPQLPDGATDG